MDRLSINGSRGDHVWAGPFEVTGADFEPLRRTPRHLRLSLTP